ncbi:hypothetical protein OROGR_016070 [Orobanche gracilis]
MEMKIIISSAILVYCILLSPARTEPIEDKQALLDFFDNIYHTRRLNWDEKTSACISWTGITCNHNNSRVLEIRLPAVGFRGSIPSNTLSRLSELRVLSLRSNDLTGPFPYDLLKLGNLMGLYLQDNDFRGALPLDFSGWKNLSVLNLSNNGFNGSISPSISNLTRLVSLSLANNSLSGRIPDIGIPSLQLLDLSNNNLTGALPGSLLRFPSSSFSGNSILSGNSFPPSSPPATAPTNHSKFSISAVLAIVIGACVFAFISIALLLLTVSNRKEKDGMSSSVTEKKEKSTKNTVVADNRDGNTRLVFFEGCSLAFDLEDLLRASAGVLGKGTFGTTYKAALEDATTVTVKRLREVIVGRKEFEQHMEIVGSVRHVNVGSLRAYYYSKDEKLVVYDYYDRGSVSTLLYAKRGDNKRVPLDWETRLNIAIGAARGLAHIHSQNGGKLVHGNIKSSNIFLNSQHHACISDLGLATLTNPLGPPVARAGGYRAPEVTDTRRISQPSDVYSLGVVLLELLTGKSPVKTVNEEAVHLVRWVHSVVREEWTGEVFDVELLRYANIEEEMVAVLQIGMGCVARVTAHRPGIRDVVRMLEDVKGVGARDNSLSGGTRSPGSTPSLTPYAGEVGDRFQFRD